MAGKSNDEKLSAEEQTDLLRTLGERFEKYKQRHKGLKWEDVLARLKGNQKVLFALREMERTGGEPDVIAFDKKSGKVLFADCCQETPKGRRSLAYDREGQMSRKEHRPENNAMDMAAAMGVDLLTEEQYFELQKLGEFDLKTSSWLKTEKSVRDSGGAIFGDRRYGRVFIYHNGAQSYYGVRGFRGCIWA